MACQLFVAVLLTLVQLSSGSEMVPEIMEYDNETDTDYNESMPTSSFEPSKGDEETSTTTGDGKDPNPTKGDGDAGDGKDPNTTKGDGNGDGDGKGSTTTVFGSMRLTVDDPYAFVADNTSNTAVKNSLMEHLNLAAEVPIAVKLDVVTARRLEGRKLQSEVVKVDYEITIEGGSASAVVDALSADTFATEFKQVLNDELSELGSTLKVKDITPLEVIEGGVDHLSRSPTSPPTSDPSTSPSANGGGGGGGGGEGGSPGGGDEEEDGGSVMQSQAGFLLTTMLLAILTKTAQA